MSTYKLIYANSRGRAETARMLFALAGVEYDDVRPDQEEWQKIKPNSPYGERPLLEVDGIYICQSKAIERLLAKRFNLYGTNDVEQARVDMFIDCLSDLQQKIFDIGKNNDKDEAKGNFMKEENGPRSIKYLEKMLSSGNYFLGDEICWADVALLNTMSFFSFVNVDTSELLKDAPKIKALFERVPKHEKIAEWIKKRPVSQF